MTHREIMFLSEKSQEFADGFHMANRDGYPVEVVVDHELYVIQPLKKCYNNNKGATK